MSKGFFDKYEIRKRDGTPTDPNACYFVLRLDTDRIARQATMLYAELTDDEKLREDLARIIANWMSTDA